jgi:hypothetical protein
LADGTYFLKAEDENSNLIETTEVNTILKVGESDISKDNELSIWTCRGE